VQRERDGVKEGDNKEYADRLQENLGSRCVNPVLAKGLICKLYFDLVCGGGEEEKPASHSA